MKTSNFEAVKVALKQDKTGYVLTLCMHPDEVPDEILRDFVGSRYQVVMVRLNQDERPMDREKDIPLNPVQLAGRLCRDMDFLEYLFTTNQIEAPSEDLAVEWIRGYLGVLSRTELRTNPDAVNLLVQVNKEFQAWKRS